MDGRTVGSLVEPDEPSALVLEAAVGVSPV